MNKPEYIYGIKVSELRKIAKYETIQLRDSKDGRIIAKLQKENNYEKRRY